MFLICTESPKPSSDKGKGQGMLTPKQKELLLYIHERLQENGVPPSFDEMKEALDLRSKSGIHRLITALEERGFIRRLPHRARALEIVKLPEGGQNSRRGTPAPRFSPSVIEGGGRGNKGFSDGDEEDAAYTIGVPVMGRIAAGVARSAIEDRRHSINVPSAFISTGEHLALEVRGDSMIE